ncbi:CHAT domain-containing protein [Candidatus Halobeggiatoa sp. HSG11]|nr:CHAT domain-containing protein [Candidatus Halobeggiatoa sp. HSG11]
MNLKNIIILFIVCSTNIQAQSTDIKHFFYTGQYETVIEKLQSSSTQNIQTWVGIAKAYQYLGLPDKALQVITTTLPSAQQNSIHHVILLNELSQLHLSQSRIEPAKQAIQKALKIVRSTDNTILLAEILRQQGNVQHAENEYETAKKSYAEALNLVNKSNPMMPYFSTNDVRELYGKILVNQAQTAFWFDTNNAYLYSDTEEALSSSIEAVKQAKQATKNWPDAFSEVFALIALSKVIQNIQNKFSTPKLLQENYQILNQAKEIADRINNAQAKTYAYGYLGRLYEHNQRYPEALNLTRKALFAAQQIQEQLSIYRWQWQLGRIFKAQGKIEEAIVSLKQAVKIINLPAIRNQITGETDFRTKISPVYFALADLLLQQKNDASVREARETIEFFKQAELQDYFQSECLTTECTHLEQALNSQTAILYPIVLPDRLELLLSLPNVPELVRVKVLITEKKLRREIAFLVSSLRRHPLSYLASDDEDEEVICTPDEWQNLPVSDSPRTKDFFKPAQKLHMWLIKPLLKSLSEHNIDTLIIVPEGVLRTVPFAALHDGQEFLIQNYALATTPSLCLADLQVQQRTVNEMLVSGLSESVQGFSDLPCAKYEIDTLQKLYSLHDIEYKPLFNKDFTYPNMQQRIDQTKYSIVHIASHGQFKSDLEDTFLLTYDNKLSMDKLENLIRGTTTQKIDLLTLSACETAVGNDRAALGLAGVALKAGVKSALASLWQVDDAATPAMIIEFYQQLTNQKLTKAQALQNAQKMMLTDAKYVNFQHPYYWSAFLLIGNWF